MIVIIFCQCNGDAYWDASQKRNLILNQKFKSLPVENEGKHKKTTGNISSMLEKFFATAMV